MDTLKTISLIVLAVIAGISVYQWWDRSDYVPPAKVDQMLDDSTRVLSAEIQSRDKMIQNLSQASQEAADRIEDLEEEVIAQTDIAGRLRIYRDSVDVLQHQLATKDVIRIIKDQRDTTVTYTETFTDSLFEVRSEVRFSPETIDNQLYLQQLRDIRIHHTITEGGRGQILFYTHLPDFEQSEQVVWQPEPEISKPWYRKYWRELAIVGLVVTAIVK